MGSVAIAAPASADINDVTAQNSYRPPTSWVPAVDLGANGYSLVTWRNAAPGNQSTVVGVTITATAPAGTTFDPAGVFKQRYNNPNNTGTTATWPTLGNRPMTDCTFSNGDTRIVCNLASIVITPGEYRQFAFPVKVASTATPSTVLTGSATLTNSGRSVPASLFVATTANSVAVKPASPVFLNATNTGASPVVHGTGAPGATVTIRSTAGAVVGTGTVGADGTFAVPVTTTLPADLTMTQTADGLTSDPAAFSITPPPAPTFGSVTGVPTKTPIVNGTGVPGATVTLTDPSGTVVGTGTVAPDGTFAVPVDPNLTTSPVDLTITQNVDGLVSGPTTVSAAALPIVDPTIALGAVGVGGLAFLGVLLRRRTRVHV
ncbi:Ig-like domain-containing protein [Microbacterium sp. NPDC089695]|uniref:Ig-like domain-containing protein n=1 Tax=Microbacterium sp. NPDC089695 TaxID=3364198 RepID=UPI0037F7286E